MNSLVWFAVVLIIAWVILRVILAVTSLALHVLWVAAVVMLIVWVIRKIRGRAA